MGQDSRRTKAEKRDAARVARADQRIEYVTEQIVENATGANRSPHNSLKHEIHEHNISHWRGALETALAVMKRSVWRMAQRRSYESLARWAEAHAIGTTVPLELLRAELQRRSAKLDESETEDERAEREALDRTIANEERAAKIVAGPSTAERIQELYSRRGMGRR